MLPWLILALIVVALLIVIILIATRTPPATVTSSTNSTLVDPRIDLHYLPGFLSDEEAEHLIQLAEGNFNRSGVIGPNGEDNYVDANRTSSTYFIPQSSDPVVQGIEERAARVLGIRKDQLEGLQVVKYEPGQFFNQHHDWFTPDYAEKVGAQREFTIFAYLTTGDGETEFPKLDRRFQPKKGDALRWRNCSTSDHCNDLNLHRGTAPRTGIKYGLNIWSRF